MASEHNPYRPPADDSDVEPDSVKYVIAGRGRRLINVVTDTLLISVVSTVARALLESAMLDRPLRSDDVEVLLIAIWFSYYAGFEATLGRTPAKFLTGTKVVGLDGNPARFGQILARTAVRFLPLEALSFVFRVTGWHDRWSRTLVVRTHARLEDQQTHLRPPTAPPTQAAPPRVVTSASDPAGRRVVCGVCSEEFSYGRSSCSRCKAQYRYVDGRPELSND